MRTRTHDSDSEESGTVGTGWESVNDRLKSQIQKMRDHIQSPDSLETLKITKDAVRELRHSSPQGSSEKVDALLGEIEYYLPPDFLEKFKAIIEEIGERLPPDFRTKFQPLDEKAHRVIAEFLKLADEFMELAGPIIESRAGRLWNSYNFRSKHQQCIDLVQDGKLRLWKNLSQGKLILRPDKEGKLRLPSDGKEDYPGSYIWRIITSVFNDEWRKDRRMPDPKNLKALCRERTRRMADNPGDYTGTPFNPEALSRFSEEQENRDLLEAARRYSGEKGSVHKRLHRYLSIRQASRDLEPSGERKITQRKIVHHLLVKELFPGPKMESVERYVRKAVSEMKEYFEQRYGKLPLWLEELCRKKT